MTQSRNAVSALSEPPNHAGHMQAQDFCVRFTKSHSSFTVPYWSLKKLPCN